MSYTQTQWTTGDIITAEKLNKLEGGVVDGQNGWSVSVQKSTFLSDSFTTISYQGQNVAEVAVLPTDDTIYVTFDGQEYTVDRVTENGIYYGAEIIDLSHIDWSVYPFCFAVTNNLTNTGMLITETAGTHAVKIETGTEAAEVSDDFKLAVQTASSFSPYVVYITAADNDSGYVASKTYSEVAQAFADGLPVIYMEKRPYLSAMAQVVYNNTNDSSITILFAENINFESDYVIYGYKLIHDASGVREVDPEA